MASVKKSVKKLLGRGSSGDRFVFWVVVALFIAGWLMSIGVIN